MEHHTVSDLIKRLRSIPTCYEDAYCAGSPVGRVERISLTNEELMALCAEAANALEDRGYQTKPICWLYTDEEGDDAFTNNNSVVARVQYMGSDPVPLYASPTGPHGERG